MHHGLHKRSRVIEYWAPGDTQERFDKNCQDPAKYNQLRSLGWLNCQIEYQYNLQGFRSDEFDIRECGLALGCSFTFGTGLHEHQTWPSLLGKKLNLHIWNLGLGGAAYDTVFRLAQFYIPHLNPKFVVVYEPPPTRFEYQHDEDMFNVWSPNQSVWDPLSSDVYPKLWTGFESNYKLNKDKNRLAIKQLCSEHKIPFFWWPGSLMMQHRDPNILARDLMHHGPEIQQKAAETMSLHIQETMR